MPVNKKFRKKKNKKFGKYIIFLLIIGLIFLQFTKKFECNRKVNIQKGDSFTKILNKFDGRDRFRIKILLKFHKYDTSNLQIGFYECSGEYKLSDFIEKINQGPKTKYFIRTVLEGRSSYDIDFYLAQKHLIQEGEYLNYVNSGEIIKKYQQKYSRLPKNLKSLEGFLYPDTYYLDQNLNTVKQLVDLQLQNFDKKIWQAFSGEFEKFYTKLKQDYGLDFDFYDLIILSSIVEKEEKNPLNQKYVAGVFFNRLKSKIQLGADISLCYGLKISYKKCNGNVIVNNLKDKNNQYNTRQNSGLPPSPIDNPSQQTISAVLNYHKTDYFYYLHDKNGKIHLSKNLSQHNEYKQKYLR